MIDSIVCELPYPLPGWRGAMYDSKVVDDFARRLSEKVRYLRAHDVELARPSRTFAEAVIHDLEQSAEELRVTGEELRSQGDQLLNASRALEQERARFFRLFDLAPDPFVVTDVHGGMYELNRAAARLFGMDRAQLHRKPLAAFVSSDSTRDFRAALQRLVRMEAIKDLTLRLHPRGGGSVPVAVRAAHMPPHHDEGPRILWSLRNQTDLESLDAARRDLVREKESREVAEARAEQARYLVRAAAELGVDSNAGHVATRAARLAADFADYAAVELFEEDGSLVRRAAYHPDAACRSYLVSHLEMRVASASDVPEIVEFLQSGGTIVFAPGDKLPRPLDLDGPVLPAALQPVSVAIVPLIAGGYPLGMLRVCATSSSGAEQLSAWAALLEAFATYVSMSLANAKLLHDIDRRRLAAEESSRGRTRAMAGLSHELRTPLHSILGYSELLLDGVGGELPEKTEQFVKSIRGSALHQAELVDDILSLARTGRSPRFAPAQVRVAEVVSECVGMLSERARANRLELRAEVSVDAVMYTDRSKLSQVLINLLGNAVKFTREGEVTITAVQQGERIAFEIRDTGCGINASELPHIFEPFWQGRASETGGEGAGLGLSLVQRLVGVLGGKVYVESEEQEGTTFRVDLPVVCPEQM